jgi:hypothetical protein
MKDFKLMSGSFYLSLPIIEWCSTAGALRSVCAYCPGTSILQVAGSKSLSHPESSLRGTYWYTLYDEKDEVVLRHEKNELKEERDARETNREKDRQTDRQTDN